MSASVSVVIPTFDNLELTRGCLAALRETAPQAEVIVVDNGSSDGTPEFLRAQPDVVVVLNVDNRGFATACNQGAERATGELVCFLNNDTIPHPGWLEALVAAAAEPFVGAVGARLLYPDGRIQHAGIGFLGGKPGHLHRFAERNDDAVTVRRELDAVTGACLLARRDLFLELGGFDPIYVNGVEDVDLCLRIRDRGFKVVYEPAGVVTHLEGQSAGRFERATENMRVFEQRFGGRFAPSGRMVPLPAGPAAVWRGSFGSTHSLAVVNDGVTRALERRGLPVHRVQPGEPPLPAPLVGVAGQWPPAFEAPSDGPFVLYQPWEFGRIPAAWAEEIRQTVDEVWTPSEYCRRAYVDSGIAPELVHVMPNGVDVERFRPDGSRAQLPTTKGTVFLFVGGTIYRKGIDLLLEAYGRAFSATDDVSLVVKGFGGKSFYAGQTWAEALQELRVRSGAPELVSLDDEVPYDEMPALYRAADVLVQPYRGEGFCLPALEALACGVPVIVTAGGPTDEFVSDACAWRLPSRRVSVPKGAVAGLELVADGFMLEPDLDALVAALREAAEPAARAARASHARAHAERLSWERVALVAEARLEALACQLPIRAAELASVQGRRRTLFVAVPDWARPETWAPALRAYAQAFSPDADTTLVLPATDEAAALTLVSAELEASRIDPERLADVILAGQNELDSVSLELAADAVICVNGHRPRRARRIVPPDPAALRAVAEIR